MAPIGYLKRGVDAIRRRGFVGASRGAIRVLTEAVVERIGPQKPWVARQHAIDQSFDASHGVDTGGIISLRSLVIEGANYAHGMRYVAVDPAEFQRVVSGLGIEYERFAFVDLGSGKGRSLLLAAHLPFSRIIGVEFARELHAAAQANVDRVKSTLPSSSYIELLCMDAAQFEFPNCPLVVYLYNPFGLEVMRMVAASCCTHSRLVRATSM